jgi:hypothetical protein
MNRVAARACSSISGTVDDARAPLNSDEVPLERSRGVVVAGSGGDDVERRCASSFAMAGLLRDLWRIDKPSS